MRAESERFLEQADVMLGRADVMLTVGLNEDAARCAYLACHHAALGYVFERTGAVSKSHKGAQVEFYRLSKSDLRADDGLRRFLSHAYEFKAVADYFATRGGVITPDAAIEAVATARRFVDHFGALTPEG